MVALTALGLEPSSRSVLLTLFGGKRPTGCRAMPSDVLRGRGMDSPSPRDGHFAAKLCVMHHEQPRQLCSCRFDAPAPRHAPASEPRVCLLGRRLDGVWRLAACWVPEALVVACRGPTAALLVLLRVRCDACHGCGLCSWTVCTHVNACGTLYGPYTTFRGLVSCVPFIRFAPPPYFIQVHGAW